MRAGWYTDPAGGGGRRWWDGEAWTEWTTRDRNAPAPRAGAVRRVVPRPRRGRQVARAVAAGLGVVVVGLGAWGWHLNGPQPKPSRPVVGPAVTATPLDPQGEDGRYDDGVVTWDCAVPPLRGASDVTRSLGIYDSYMGCATAGVKGRPSPEASLVTFGVMERTAVVPGRLRRTASSVALEMLTRVGRVGTGGNAVLEPPVTADDTVAGQAAGRSEVGMVVREGDRVWHDRAVVWVFEAQGRTYALVRIDADGDAPAVRPAIDEVVAAVTLR